MSEVADEPELSFARRRLRAEAQLTQKELAEVAGISPRVAVPDPPAASHDAQAFRDELTRARPARPSQPG
jgi:transcriptional regulator with XRE-family HTH domain